jgi:hypothetical protein
MNWMIHRDRDVPVLDEQAVAEFLKPWKPHRLLPRVAFRRRPAAHLPAQGPYQHL